MIGQTINHYTITAKLGEGGMGEVYLAEDSKLHRKVALKFLPKSLQQDTEARERLVREARAASQLSHPNIVAVHAIDQFQGSDFITMEYIDGVPVDRYCLEKAQGLEEILGIAIGLANGLTKAHAAGIIHRDLKPSNVMVEKDGRARILDFGLAKIEGAAKLTKTGSTVGTVAYMSPEQGRGDEVDNRSDIFSLGVILYEMVTGTAPFAGDHEAAILYAIANEEPEPLARYKKDVPEELQRVVTKCLAKRRKDRYQSAADLATDLKQIKRALAPSSSVSMPVTTRKPRTLRVLVLAASVLAVVVAIIWWTSQDGRVGGDTSYRKMVAVLPFENLGSEDQEYFADGITDEIRTQVAKIDSLGVISRSSAIHYKDSDQRLPEIAEELGVDYVLVGTITWDPSASPPRVRVNAQLIRVLDDTYLWADTYDRVLSEVFALQSDIAAEVASALDLSLTGAGKTTERLQPTDNMAAYDFYLHGNEYLDRGLSEEEFHNACALFMRAIALDSNFAEPYAAFGQTKVVLYWLYGRESKASLDSAANAIHQALIIDPELAEAHAALGSYYNLVEDEYELALEEYFKARDLGMKVGDVYTAIAVVQMRQGRWEEAEANLDEALSLDPRSGLAQGILNEYYELSRRYDDALQLTDYQLALQPDNLEFYRAKIQEILKQSGDTARASRIAREVIESSQSVGWMGDANTMGSLWKWRLVDVSPEQIRHSYPAPRTVNEDKRMLYALGFEFGQRGQLDSARVYLDSMIAILESELRHSPDDFHYLESVSMACLVAGYKDRAMTFAERGLETMPISKCHW